MNIYDIDGQLLYESRARTLKRAVEEAVSAGVNLTDANLTGANLAEANLAGADFTGADFTGANLAEANLAGADFTGARLAWGYLTGADLTGATLTGADLYRADLTGANITGATLTGADLYRATGIIDGGTDGRGYRWVAVQYDDGPRIAAGCRWYTLAEAHEHWDGEHPRGEDVAAECRARLALLETLAKSKGWIK